MTNSKVLLIFSLPLTLRSQPSSRLCGTTADKACPFPLGRYSFATTSIPLKRDYGGHRRLRSTKCATVPLYLSTAVPLYRCTFIPLYHCIAIPLYRCTTVPLYHCTAIPLYRCTSFSSPIKSPFLLITSPPPCNLFT